MYEREYYFLRGKISWSKNIIEMLRIWKYIFKSYPDWKFLIAGAGPLENQLKMEAESMGLQNIEFHPVAQEALLY